MIPSALQGGFNQLIELFVAELDIDGTGGRGIDLNHVSGLTVRTKLFRGVGLEGEIQRLASDAQVFGGAHGVDDAESRFFEVAHLGAIA